MTEAMPFLQRCDITFLRPPTIRARDASCPKGKKMGIKKTYM